MTTLVEATVGDTVEENKNAIDDEVYEEYEGDWVPKTLVRKCQKVSDRKKWLCSSCSHSI